MCRNRLHCAMTGSLQPPFAAPAFFICSASLWSTLLSALHHVCRCPVAMLSAALRRPAAIQAGRPAETAAAPWSARDAVPLPGLSPLSSSVRCWLVSTFTVYVVAAAVAARACRATHISCASDPIPAQQHAAPRHCRRTCAALVKRN